MSKRGFCLAGCVAVVLLLSVFPGTALTEEKRLLCGFNTEEEIKDWDWERVDKANIVAENATEGAKCVEVTFSGDEKRGEKGQWPGFDLPRKLLSGWERYDVLAFDIFNKGNKVETIAIRIDDPQSTDKWTTWYDGSFTTLPGKNHFEIELAKMFTTRTNRHVDASKITRVIFFMSFGRRRKDEKVVLCFDNICLKKFPVAKFPESVKAFDFGPKGSKVWPGFTLVTPTDIFSDQRGYGFSSTANRRSYDYKTPDTIGRDSIFGAQLIFTVKVKPGNYKVWAVTGEMRHPWHTFPRRPFGVRAEGEEQFSFKPKSTKYLENLEYLSRDYRRKGPSLWDLYVAPRYSEPAFTVNCSDGKLDISFEKDIFLAGLALWPADDEKAEKIIADVGVARRKAFHASWREIKPVSLPKPPRLTRKEKKCGFMLACRNYLESITPYFVPSAEDRLKKLSIAACPGEYEPGVFIIYPVRDQNGVTVKISNLVGKGGEIPASCIKIERAVYRHIARGGGTYTVDQMHLVPRASVDVEAGVPRQFWLTIKVPDKAEAGRYKGKVTVGAGKHALDFPFELEVYPFKLSPHDITYAHVYSVPNDEQRLEMDLRCLVEHGFNSVTSSTAGRVRRREGDKIVMNFERVDRLMKIMKKLGMPGPVPLFGMKIQGYAGGVSSTPMGIKQAFGYTCMDPRYLNDLTLVTKAIIEHAKENEWLPVIMYPSSEISNDENLGPDFQRTLIQAIRKAGDVKCVASVNRPRDVESVKDLDIIMYNGGVPINEKTVKAAHDAGCELWFQNIGGTRFNEGLYLLRTGAKGRRQWALNWDAARDQYSDFDNYSERANLIFSSPEGTLSTGRLEEMREGVDDYRYFWTLKLLIEKAEKQGKVKAEAAAAKKDYDEMIASCPIEIDNSIPIGKDGFVVAYGFKDKTTFDRYRRRVAGHIIKIKKALGEL